MKAWLTQNWLYIALPLGLMVALGGLITFAALSRPSRDDATMVVQNRMPADFLPAIEGEENAPLGTVDTNLVLGEGLPRADLEAALKEGSTAKTTVAKNKANATQNKPKVRRGGQRRSQTKRKVTPRVPTKAIAPKPRVTPARRQPFRPQQVRLLQPGSLRDDVPGRRSDFGVFVRFHVPKVAVGGVGVNSAKVGWTNVPKDIASQPTDLRRMFTVDRNINAALINGINSELPGKVVAQVETHAYASQGGNILVPAGSKVVGYYEPLRRAGDTRLKLLWKRIITPRGVNISFVKDAEIADQLGRSGITGEIDNKYFEKYGVALLVSLVSAATSGAIIAQSSASPSTGAVAQTLTQDVSAISRSIIEENINIRPKLTLPPGARVLISPVRDIYFPLPIQGSVVAYPR